MGDGEDSYPRREGAHVQLVVMCLLPGEEIGREVHTNVDQFFRIEQGEARFSLGENGKHLVRTGEAVAVRAGTYHNVLNSSQTTPLKLYSLYSPPNHADGTVHKTKTEAEAAEAAAGAEIDAESGDIDDQPQRD